MYLGSRAMARLASSTAVSSLFILMPSTARFVYTVALVSSNARLRE